MNAEAQESGHFEEQELIWIAKAQAGSIVLPFQNRATTTELVSPGDLTAPVTVIIAAVALTPKGSGWFFFGMTLGYTPSAADLPVFEVVVGTGAGDVTVTGGISTGTLGGLVYETSGHSIALVGATSTNAVALYEEQIPASALEAQAVGMSGVGILPRGRQSVLYLTGSMSSGHNLTAMALSFSVFELP